MTEWKPWELEALAKRIEQIEGVADRASLEKVQAGLISAMYVEMTALRGEGSSSAFWNEHGFTELRKAWHAEVGWAKRRAELQRAVDAGHKLIYAAVSRHTMSNGVNVYREDNAGSGRMRVTTLAGDDHPRSRALMSEFGVGLTASRAGIR